MKKVIKYIVCGITILALVGFSVLVAFASTNGNTQSTYYRFNAPTSLTLRNSSNNNVVSLSLDSIVYPNDNGEDTITTSYSYGGNAFGGNVSSPFGGFIYGYISRLTHNNRTLEFNRAFDIMGTSNLYINGATCPDGLFSTYTSWYPLGRAYDVYTNSWISSPQVDSAHLYNFTTSSFDFEWDSFYYDSSVRPLGSNGGTIVLSVSVFIPKGLEKRDIDFISLRNAHKGVYEIGYIATSANHYLDSHKTVSPDILATDIIRIDNYSYDMVNVQLGYRYESDVMMFLRNFDGYNGVSSLVSVPHVSLHIDCPPANILGASGQGSNPLYSLNVASVCASESALQSVKGIVVTSADGLKDTEGLLSWLADFIGDFFDITLFGVVRLGDLFGIFIAIGLVMLVLKMFAGG